MAPKANPTTPLYNVVEEALKKWSDVGWLGKNSLLASPYLLGSSLQSDDTMIDPKTRGRVLQKLLKECTDSLNSYHKKILQETFFNGRKKLEGIWNEFNIAKANFYKHRKEAIQALEKVLIEHLQPALRLEQPLKVAKPIGREDDVGHCLDALQQNQSVTLMGTGGIGKTTLGSHIAHQFAPSRTFWFTFRPGFNDQIDSLLFSLGYFFHSQGVSTLWSQILAQHEEGKPLDLTMIQGLIHHDLEQLQAKHSLLCFDEVDMLRIGEVEVHSQIRTLIENLRSRVPMLLMGQQSQIESDLFLKLDQLPKPNVQKWLEQQRVQYTSDQLHHIYQYTEGNPRLLQLFITLAQMGEPFEDIIIRLPSEPSVEFMLNRIWQRLDEGERCLLMSLSVFRRPVPRQVKWQQPHAQGIWTRLVDRQLVRYDGVGLSLVPAYGAVLYGLLSLEEREFMHNQAALIRSILADHTAAAHHYIEANQPEYAVLQWHQYKQGEINRGQAEVARKLFKNVSDLHLSEVAQEALTCINSKLALISGQLEEAKRSLNNLGRTVWETPLLKLEALKVGGDLASLQDEFEVAIGAYRDGLKNAELLWEQHFPILRKEVSWVYMRQRDMDAAWHEAQIAYYEVENLRGNIKRRTGDLAQAEKSYQTALELAEELQHTEGLAKTYNSLSAFYALQGRLDDAVSMSHKAIDIHQQLGRRLEVAGDMANLATFHTLRQDFVQAIQVATEALKFFQNPNTPWGISLTCQTLAESHLALDQLDEAEKYAWQVIETEEEEGIPDAMRVLGEIKLKRASKARAEGSITQIKEYINQAEKHIRESIKLAQKNEDPFLEAYGWRALGQVYLAKDDTAQADHCFARAIELFGDIGSENEIEKTKAFQAQE